MGAFSKGVANYARQTEKALRNTTRDAISDLCERIVERTAVDTGALRANWQPSVDTPVSTTTEATDRGGAETLLYIYLVAERAAGHKFWLTNNLHYAQKIEDYGGRLTSPGMLGNSTLEWSDAVKKAAVKNNV